MHTKTVGFIIVGFLLASLIGAQTKRAEPPEATQLIDSIQGPALYAAYCSVCHGTDGKGDGPMARSLRLAPPDLTRIAMRNGGTFSMGRLQRVISGEETLPQGHGTREMPLWG